MGDYEKWGKMRFMGQNDQEVMIGGDPKFGVIPRSFKKVEKYRKT